MLSVYDDPLFNCYLYIQCIYTCSHTGSADTESGRIVAFGDSSCFDSTDFHPECMWLIKRMLDYTRGDNVTDLVPPEPQGQELSSPLPARSPDSELHLYSKVSSQVRCSSVRLIATALIAILLLLY